MIFSNSEQAKGYELAQSEINTANALAAVQSFQASLCCEPDGRFLADFDRLAAENAALRAELAQAKEPPMFDHTF